MDELSKETLDALARENAMADDEWIEEEWEKADYWDWGDE